MEQWELHILRKEWYEASAVSDALRKLVKAYHANHEEAPDLVWSHYSAAVDARLKASDAYFAVAYPEL